MKVLAILVIGVCFLQTASANYKFENERYFVSHLLYEGHQEVFYSGKITPGTSKEGLRRLRDQLVDGLDVLLVIIDSDGGFTRSYRKLGRLIRSVCYRQGNPARCKVATYVVGKCSSACVELYLQGDERYASPHSSFGFHLQWILHPNFTVSTAEEMSQKYAIRGVSKAWLSENLNIFTDNQVKGTWLMPQELVKPGFVHNITEFSPFLSQLRNVN